MSMVVMGEVALLINGLPPCSCLGDAHLHLIGFVLRVVGHLPIFAQNGLRALFSVDGFT